MLLESIKSDFIAIGRPQFKRKKIMKNFCDTKNILSGVTGVRFFTGVFVFIGIVCYCELYSSARPILGLDLASIIKVEDFNQDERIQAEEILKDFCSGKTPLIEKHTEIKGSSYSVYVGNRKIIDMIAECSCNDCNRFRVGGRYIDENNTIRTKFEKALIDATVRILPKTETVVITSLGSGRLFSEFSIINKLICNGFRTFKVNLIDLAYKPFVNKVK